MYFNTELCSSAESSQRVTISLSALLQTARQT